MTSGMTTFNTLSHPDIRAAFLSLFRLSWPVVGTRLGIQLMALMDTVVVGQYSSDQLGYHTLAISISWIFGLTGMGLLMGIQVKTAHFLGANDLHRIGAVFQRGMGYALVLGVVCVGLILSLGPWILRLMVSDEIRHATLMPLSLFAVTIPFFLVSMACSQFLEGLGKTRPVMVGTLLANGVNLVLLLIFVPSQISVFGVMINGAVGAAVATLIARTALMVGLLVYVLTLKEAKPYGLLERQDPDPQGAVEQRHIGYATGASYFIEVLAFVGMTLFAGHVGAQAVASWAIILNFASVVFMVPVGISVGCSVLVGTAYGAKDAAGLALMGKVSFVAAAVFMALVVVGVIIGLEPLTRLYTHDVQLIDTVKAGFLLSCVFFIPDGLQVVASQALRARQDIFAPTLIHYISYGAIMLPLGYVFCITLNGGVAGLIWAVIAASALSGTFQTARYLWLDRKVPV